MGFPQELIINSSVDEEFICAICCEVFLDPVQVDSCEDVFCKSCIEDWIDKAEGGGKNCPLCRQPMEALKALPRKFLNILHKLQIRCKFHNLGCETIVALGDIQNHQKCCEANPEFRKPCPNICGAMIKAQEKDGHNCIDYLKSAIREQIDFHNSEIKELKLSHSLTFEQFKRESESNLKRTTESLNKEIDLLKLAIEELKFNRQEVSQSKSPSCIERKSAYNDSPKKLDWSPLKIKSAKLTIMKEIDKFKAKIEQLMCENPFGHNSSSPVYCLRKEMKESKSRMQELKNFLGESNNDWVNEMTIKYNVLDESLKPMDHEMQKDVLNKYGKRLLNFNTSNQDWMAVMNQEMCRKYGGQFFSKIISTPFLPWPKTIFDPVLCKAELNVHSCSAICRVYRI